MNQYNYNVRLKQVLRLSSMNRATLENNLEKILRIIFFWENDKGVGKCTRFMHHSFIYISLLLYIIHLFVPSSFLFFLLYAIFSSIWLQHSLLGGCIFTNIEYKLIGNHKSFVYPILDAFNIHEHTDKICLLLSTLMICVLSFELIIRNVIL